METVDLLLGGFATALQPINLAFALIGCILGTLVGIMPGIGPVAGTALLLPLTFKLDATAAIIMLLIITFVMNGVAVYFRNKWQSRINW